MRASILSWRKCTSISWTSMRCAKTKRPGEKRWTRLLMRPSAPSGQAMETVKVSPKFQVVIPKRVREELQLRPGQELIVYILDGTIRFSKPRSIKELRGIAKGMKWKDDYRDRHDLFSAGSGGFFLLAGIHRRRRD